MTVVALLIILFTQASAKQLVLPVTNVQQSESAPKFEHGIGCGSTRMDPNHVIRIQSTNFGIGNYFNDEGCSWSFTSTECSLSVYCPCFELPTSFACFEDYLKIHTGGLGFGNRFCGSSYPTGVYRASNSLTIQFKSDSSRTAQGFMCYVRCAGVGRADPVVLEKLECPRGSSNPFVGV